jgi:hypothetical protein
MISSAGETLIGIEFNESTPGERYAWAIQYGTCEDPGIYISLHPEAFPILLITEVGTAEFRVFLQLTLTDTNDYSIVILNRNSTPSFELVGCSNMEVLEG